MFRWILIALLVRFLKAQENHIVIYAQVGGSVTLPRKPLVEQNVYVNWYREPGKSLIISRNPQSGIQKGKEMHVSLSDDFSLQISPVQESDFEIWRCEQHVITTEFKQAYKLYRVTVPKVLGLMVNYHLSLECNVESSSVTPSVTWISPSSSGCTQQRKASKIMSVSKVSRCDSGVWTCQLDYEGRKTEATTTVFVIDLSSSSSVYTSTSSSTVDIPCSLSSKVPWSVLNETGLQGGSWTFTPLSEQNQQKPPQTVLSLSFGPVVRWSVTDGESNIYQGRELKDENLSIRNVPAKVEIRGLYTCSLKFKTKTLVSKVNVEVLQVSSSQNLTKILYEGQSVNLSCTLGHENTSGLKVKWKPPSPDSSVVEWTTQPFVQPIAKVEMKHSGRWVCELWNNNEMLTSARLSLKIEKAPVDIWLWVAIISGVVVFILLVVVAIIGIRRYKQRVMYRRRKTRFCCCKNPQPTGFYKT